MAEMMGPTALRDWLSRLASTRVVIAPVTEGRTFFRPVDGPDQIDFEYAQSTIPPKEWFFPRTDPLFAFDASRTEIELPRWTGQRVIFGIRPCDARALSILDRLFLAEPADGLWETRRRETALIGLACSRQQLAECFCTSLGGGPRDDSSVDVLLSKTEDGYAALVVTERGQALLDGARLGGQVEMPPAPEIRGTVPAEEARDRILATFDSDCWERLAERCLGCRMCSFLCPTCHCFDVRDYLVDGKLERDRCWDSCQSAHFTRLAGGHNPRGSKAARLRQFYAHKYVYFPERFGATACVGCGRCAHYCPVNIDIRETLRDLQRLEV